MAAFRPSSRWLKDTAGYSSRLLQRTIRQRLAAEGKTLERSSKIPVIPKCPEPTCECADMPPDLDIDQTKDLNGTMAAYSEQIIISTGQADWKSKIEHEKDTAPWGSIVAQIKEMLGPKGRYHDPYRNTVVSTSSFESPESNRTQALLFPSFQVIDCLQDSEASIRGFIESAVVAKNKDDATEHDQSWRSNVRSISAPTILICSHNSRDSRCGMLGPLLHAEFSQYINKNITLRNAAVSDDNVADKRSSDPPRSFASHPTFHAEVTDSSRKNQQPVNIGMISHIGGHKWAGNVIIYLPPDYHLKTLERDAAGASPRDKIVAGESEPPQVSEDQPLLPEEEQHGLSPLAGKGIWYGRVQPKHVEGIVEQTIGHGKIIKELFRGGINQDGSPIRL